VHYAALWAKQRKCVVLPCLPLEASGYRLGACCTNHSFFAVTMSRIRTLFISLLVLTLSMLVTPPYDAVAAPNLSARLASLDHGKGQTVHLTLRTQEGLERFVFTPRESATTTTGEVHLSGFARTRNFQKERLSAAMTISEDRAWIFYTSRRTGRPAAATISLSRAESALLTRRVRVSRVPAKSLECGSHVSDEHASSAPSVASAKRRINRTAGAKVGTQRAGLFSPARVLEVATEADYEFYERHGRDTNTFIRAVLNAVDVIYASGLGVRIKVVGQRVTTTYPGQRAPIDALRLLENFRQGAFASNSSADVRHLFTGRSIEGLTIGIAYVAAACTQGGRYGVGLSRAVSTGLHPFLAAHEIAHNLSATHDGEANSIMNPAITEANNRFTARALSNIYNFVTTSGSCLRAEALSSAMIELSGTDPTRFEARVTFVSNGTSACSVVLYGSADGRRYTPVSTRTASGVSGSYARVAAFSTDAPSLDAPQTFYFKAKVTCGNTRMITAPAKLRYGLATSGSTSTSSSGRWLEQLRRNLR
jgi:hypothetical protein